MIKLLDMPAAPYWIDLPHGVRVKVRPIDTVITAAAQDAAAALVSAQLAARAGEEVSDVLRKGIVEAALTTCVAQLAILEWEGVFPPEGDVPASATPETIAHLMRVPTIARAFLDAYYAPRNRLVVEGEGSGSAPNGTTAAGPNTAGGAETPAAPAPMAA